jgi:hypothetical protein
MQELPLNLVEKSKIVIRKMRNNRYKRYKHYKKLDDKTLLNLSFRCGDNLHCQRPWEKEIIMLPYLVSVGNKPVAEIASKDKLLLENITIPENCDSKIILYRWNMWVNVIYIKDTYSDEELMELVNETNTYKKRGEMFGYGLATYDIE